MVTGASIREVSAVPWITPPPAMTAVEMYELWEVVYTGSRWVILAAT